MADPRLHFAPLALHPSKANAGLHGRLVFDEDADAFRVFTDAAKNTRQSVETFGSASEAVRAWNDHALAFEDA